MLQIIFHKRATNYRALLLKMTYKDKGSYEFSPPCRQVVAYIFVHFSLKYGHVRMYIYMVCRQTVVLYRHT